MSPPIDPVRRCRPLSEWPADDQFQWTAAQRKGGLLDDGGPAATYRKTSLTKTAKGYGRYLTWLDGRGLLVPGDAVRERVTVERVKAYIDHLRALGNAPYSIFCRLQELADAMRFMAPKSDWRWLSGMATGMQRRAVPVRNKRARLRPAADIVAVGIRTMEEATAAALEERKSAAKYRDGLIVTLLATAAVRLGNFSSIEIGRHLTIDGDRMSIQFERHETKTGDLIRFDIPPVLVPYLRRYIDHYRPILLTGGSRHPPTKTAALWISRERQKLAAVSIHDRIKMLTSAALGAAIPPHWFRDAAATSIALKVPKHVGIV